MALFDKGRRLSLNQHTTRTFLDYSMPIVYAYLNLIPIHPPFTFLSDYKKTA